MTRLQLKLLTRYPANMIANFLLVLIMVIVVMVMVIAFSPAETGTNVSNGVLYGFIIYLFLSQTIWTIGLSVYREKEAGTLGSFYLAPGSRFLNLWARAGAALIWTTIAGLLGLLLAQQFTGSLVLYNFWLTLLILIFSISALVGLGFALAGLALQFGPNIEIVANILEFGLIGLCAFFYPFAILPPFLLKLARLIPLSYHVDAFRTVAMGLSQPELLSLKAELAIVAISGLLGPFLGYVVYRFFEYRVRQKGLL